MGDAVAWIRRCAIDAVRWATGAAFGAAVLAAAIGNWLRVQDVDPQFTTVFVHRAIAYGGSFYENGIHNRGPLEPFVYWVAARVTSDAGFWYAIAAFATVVALVLAYVAARATIAAGGARVAAVAVAAAVYVHFALSDADYAGVLYVRTLTTALLAVAWLVAIDDRLWVTRARRLGAAIAAGAALGLAVQSLVATIFTATVVAMVGTGFARARTDERESRRLVGAGLLSAAAAFTATPLWYAVRGSFAEYWSGWFTYASYMSVGTGRSLGSQFALGWDRFYGYYQSRPMAFALILTFVVVTMLGWRSGDRRWRLLHGGLLAWFGASWLELVLSQRYSSHYFAVSSVPTAFMAAVLVASASRALPRERVGRRIVALPLATLLVALYLSGFDAFRSGLRDVSEFRGWNAKAAELARARGGSDRTIRGILGLVSKDGDPLLAWTQDAWPYLTTDRVSATRFIWKSFLLGEIYLGRTSPSYVLPETLRWFEEDIAESRPRAYFENAPGLAGSRYEALLRSRFTTVGRIPDGPILGLRRDLAAHVLEPSARRRWRDSGRRPEGSGWAVDGNGATYRDATLDRERDVLTISRGSCFRLEGTVDTDEGGLGAMVFRFDDNKRRGERLRLAFEGDRVVSGSDFVAYLEQPSDVTGDGPTDFALVVGRRSAALVINEAVRAAVELPPSVTVTLESHRASLTLTDLRIGDPPPGSGC